MYPSIVYLHIVAIFIFLVQHAAEIWVTFRLRDQKEPEGIFATYAFMPDNIVRNLCISYLLIVITGITAGLIIPWWRQAWTWTALSVMIVIWAGMRRVSSTYWNAVDALTERFLKYKENLSPADKFVSA